MGNNKNDISTVVNTGKQSLLEKYKIPIENLSYEYISSCTNVKELERIVRILRSGEEGYYPDLTKHAENKLASVNPNSSILRTVEPVVAKCALPLKDREIIDSDIERWMKEMEIMERDLNYVKSIFNNNNNDDVFQPEIRQYETDQINLKSLVSQRKGKRIASCDYASWDKYDVDTELNRIDLQEEQDQVLAKHIQEEEKTKAQNLQKEDIINKASLTETVKKTLAIQEREKGNEAFKTEEYEEALKFYNASIAYEGTVFAYNNRALTYIRLKRFEEAINDCNAALEIDPENIKALYRRALALEYLEQKSQALGDYETILTIDPNNKCAMQGINRLENVKKSKIVRMKIEDECETDMEDTVSQNISNSSVTYSDDYGNYQGGWVPTICYCFKAPGSSQYMHPFPHYKSSYCYESEPTNIKERSSELYKLLMEPVSPVSLNNPITKNPFENKINGEQVIHPTTDITKLNDSKVNGDNVNNCNEMEVDKSEEEKLFAENVAHLAEVQIESSPSSEANDDEENMKSLEDGEKLNGVKEKANISSPYEFIRAWQALKNDKSLAQHADLLRSMAPTNFVNVAESNLDCTGFSTILQCLEKHFMQKNDIDLLNGYLKSFTNLNRFSIIIMLLDANDVKVLEDLLTFLEQNGVQDIDDLRDKYNV